MKQQTSIHVQPVKGGSEEHNKREKKLDYVRHDLSYLNEYWEKDTQTNRLETIKANYLKSTGQKMQAKATPIREAVVVIKPETTMEDLKRLPMYTDRVWNRHFSNCNPQGRGLSKESGSLTYMPT